MKPLNYQSLPGLKKYLCSLYGTTIRYKPTNAQMRALAALLDAIGVADRDVWLRQYSTTLWRTIFLCRRLSDTTVRARDHAATLAHEHNHVVLRDQMGAARYNAAYLDSAQRAIIEARCYLAGAAVYWQAQAAVGHQELPPIDLGETLSEGYRCGKSDVRAALAVYEAGCRAIKRGGIPEGPAQDVARYYGWIE
jgi:hypothetical protein